MTWQGMTWEGVIERNREGLKRILATLLVMAGLDSRGQFAFVPQEDTPSQDATAAERSKPSPAPAHTLPRRAHRAVLRLLRPAESAARRLIVVAARGLTVELPRRQAPEARPAHGPLVVRNGVGTGIILPRGVSLADFRGDRPRVRRFAFQLLDPLARPGPPRLPTARDMPRISFFGPGARPPAPLRPPCLPGDLLDARRLVLRLAALSAALDDLPGQALRFARWQARAAAYVRERKAAAAAAQGQNPAAAGTRTGAGRPARFRRSFPFRSGRPPGQRRAQRGEVHEILSDTNYFAFEVLERPDTS